MNKESNPLRKRWECFALQVQEQSNGENEIENSDVEEALK